MNIQLVKKMMKERMTLEELGIKLDKIMELKDLGYQIKSQDSKRGRLYYIITQTENPSLFISGVNHREKLFKWVELSDIHSGSKQFDQQGLIDVLQRAVDEGYRDVHISGDLHDGYLVYGKEHLIHLRYWTAEEQTELLASILLRFPLRYISIFGNHDFSFVKHGGVNPVYLLEQMINKEGGDFTFLNGYAGDLIIAGVLKRMVHLSGTSRTYAKSYPGQVYIRNLLDSHEEFIWVRNKQYRIRFLQMGHFHSDLLYESAGIYCTHPGGYQFPNNYTIRKGLVGYQGSRFTDVLIREGRILEHTSKFVKPRRF